MVDLPYVELFVFFDTLVDLSWCEALVGATLDYVGHFDHLLIAGQVANQRVYLVFVAGRSGNKK